MEARPTTATAQDFGSFQAKSYFSALDGLRAISILLVLLHHMRDLPANSPFALLQENGRYGVAFFFAISGFLICTLFLREEAATGRIHLWKFYGRRALRLLPLYYVVLLLQAVLVFGLHQYSPENQDLFRAKLPSYLFYYSNWLPTATQGPFFCSWSLAVEEQFYLAFGLLLFFLNRRAVIPLIVAMFLVKMAAYALLGPLDVRSTAMRIVFSYQEPVLLGVLLAFTLHDRRSYDCFRLVLGHRSVGAALSIATALWLTTCHISHGSAWEAQLLYLLMTLTLAALVMRPNVPVLCGATLTHIGKISYGIYLIHMFVVSAAKKLPGAGSVWVCFLISATASILLASLIYRFFEQPIIRYYKHRLSPVNDKREAKTAKERLPEPVVISPAGIEPLNPSGT
jgi:peptidoglycan/LPS O-acetylase OafA/YrhL